MFNPEKHDYPANAQGQPEFASIILTVDGITSNAPGNEVVQKMVLSTETAISALASIAPYFGEPELLANPSNAQLLAQAGRLENPVFVYTTPREGTIQIIASTPTWDFLVQSPAFGKTSALLASQKLIDLVAGTQGDMQTFAGGFASLMLLDLSSVDQDAGSSDGGEGATAQSLRDTAEVESVTSDEDESAQ